MTSRFITSVFTALLLLTGIYTAGAQSAPGNLPVQVKAPPAGSTSPLIFYITGDGGMKKFSANVIDEFQRKTYPVVALNALKYFWSKKTPVQAATDVANLIRFYQAQWNNHQGIILIGYSLGADVMPFIYTHLPATMAEEVKQVVLLSPSRFTDLEVHLSDMLGKGGNKGMSVPAEINKISRPLLLVFGEEEKDFNFSELTIPHYKKLILPGGHSYDEDAAGVAGRLIAGFSH
ncbi:AcvB/VirJ family lysyl-phosphatidylglycerol hydrolase [Chitinophaga sp. CB10]|uniref:AcvB/VirJ family lysyl-phosphatidylglycerol hydrolase n=1 Tax=Chitinophaga sp. CB10 TaxID=1891659 RepID=UPI0025BD54E0|nr:AcvB/VirJ family lysyl-phosphatidylglycerol hydrolase [Chitinophaga sp. CB10]